MYKGGVQTKKIIAIIGIFLVLSSSVSAQERMWKPFSPESGEWEILSPCQLKPDAEAKDPKSLQGSYSCSNFNGYFAVVYKDNPKWKVALNKPFMKSHFRKIRDNFLKSSNGELVSEEEFTSVAASGRDVYFGREVYIKMPNDRVFSRLNANKTTYRMERLRMFFQGGRFYLLVAVLPEDEIDWRETESFFNFFTVK